MTKNNRTRFQTTLNATLIKKLKMVALEQDKNVNDILDDLIANYLKSLDEKKVS